MLQIREGLGTSLSPSQRKSMNNQKIPRQPTEVERNELYELLHTMHFFDGTDEDLPTVIHEAIDRAAIAVFDDFTTDGPGYSGKIMMVVWTQDLAHYELYNWDKNGLAFVEYDPY